MKKKQLKFQLGSKKSEDNKNFIIKVLFEDEYFLRNADLDKIKFPQNIMQNYQIEKAQKLVTFIPTTIRNQFQQDDLKDVAKAFSGLTAFHVSYSKIDDTEQTFRRKINILKNHNIIGFKYFIVSSGRFEQGDFLIYSKGSIKQFLQVVETYLEQEQLQFALDSYLQNWKVPTKYRKSVIDILIRLNIKSIAQESKKDLNIIITQINSKVNQRDNSRQKSPIFSIYLVVSGDRRNIHQLYQLIQQKMSAVYLTVVEIEGQPFVSERVNSLPQIFPQYINKIFKVTQSSVVILDKQIYPEEVKRKLKLNKWIFDDKIFSKQEIRTLNSQYQNFNLKSIMNQKNIFWDSLAFTQFQIEIICDQSTKRNFLIQCENLLKTFVKQRQICRNFDDNFYIEIFRKYFQRNFQKKFNVEFEIGDKYLIRTNFTKYSDQIIQQLKTIREKIKKKLITFVSLNSIKNNLNLNTKLFQQILIQKKDSHNLLGCRLYRMGKMQIKLKTLNSLKRQQQCIAYIIDDRLEDRSKFYEIIRKNNINYDTFLTDAHKAKKPDRLRQYITQDCPYAHRTVLLHAGRQKVTNTLQRDVEGLLTLLDNRVCITIFHHNGDFLEDVFKNVLLQINASVSPMNHKMIQNNGAYNYENGNKQLFSIDIYYEGDQNRFLEIQNVMKDRSLKIDKVSVFSLQQLDVQKIYALRYYQMTMSLNKKLSVPVSPIIAQLCRYELHKSKSSLDKKNRFIFSSFSKISHQLVQFIISTKSGICFKITHDEDKHSWSFLPRIQKIEDMQAELKQYVNVIKKYFKRSDYTVISAEAITDGLHGRTIKYCEQFFIATEDQSDLQPVNINLSQQMICNHDNGNTYQAQIKQKRFSQWYEITTYKEELQTINSYL